MLCLSSVNFSHNSSLLFAVLEGWHFVFSSVHCLSDLTSLFNCGRVLMLFSPNSGVAWRCTLLSLSYGFGLVLRFTYSLPGPWDSGFLLGRSFYLIFFYLLTLAQYILLYSKNIPTYKHTYSFLDSILSSNITSNFKKACDLHIVDIHVYKSIDIIISPSSSGGAISLNPSFW